MSDKTEPKGDSESESTEEVAGVDVVEAVVEKPAQEPDRKPKEPVKGVYVLEQGDTPGSVSQKIYGRGHMAVPLARANMNSDWQPGSTIKLL